MTARTHYDVLGVPEAAEAAEVKAAYRRLAKATHPDRGGSAALMAEVTEAYGALSDPARRAEYDESLRAGVPEQRTWQSAGGGTVRRGAGPQRPVARRRPNRWWAWATATAVLVLVGFFVQGRSGSDAVTPATAAASTPTAAAATGLPVVTPTCEGVRDLVRVSWHIASAPDGTGTDYWPHLTVTDDSAYAVQIGFRGGATETDAFGGGHVAWSNLDALPVPSGGTKSHDVGKDVGHLQVPAGGQVTSFSFGVRLDIPGVTWTQACLIPLQPQPLPST